MLANGNRHIVCRAHARPSFVKMLTKSSTWHLSTARIASYATSKVSSPTAVVFSGCGVYDGTEIQEAVAVLYSLSKRKIPVAMFAPDKNQAHTLNHMTGEEMPEQRNVLVESSRIARGNIKPLSELNAEDHSFGAAKNLSNFANTEGDYEVDPEVKRVIEEFRAKRKPIGLCCISPVLAAKTIPGVEITIGNDEGTAKRLESVGAVHKQRSVDQKCTDEDKLVVTAPAYMYGDASTADVFEGIEQMVDKVVSLGMRGN